jgi:bifunctional enzyme Fae/Hps
MLGVQGKRDQGCEAWTFVILDLKTLDTGNLEVRLAADATADAVVISAWLLQRPLSLGSTRPERLESTP